MYSLYAIFIIITALPILLLIFWKRLPRARAWIIRVAYLINLYPLYPCIYLTFVLVVRTDPFHWVFSRSFLGASFPLIYLRMFYLPYILSTLWTIAYIRHLKEKKFPTAETVLFVLMLILCIMGLLTVEWVYGSAMGI